MSTNTALGTCVSSVSGGGGQGVSLPVVFTDGTETWRLIADTDEAFNWQHTLTTLGFSGTEYIDFYTPEDIT